MSSLYHGKKFWTSIYSKIKVYEKKNIRPQSDLMTSRALTIWMEFSVAFSGQMELHSGLPYAYLVLLRLPSSTQVDHAVPRVPELTSFYLVYPLIPQPNLVYPHLPQVNHVIPRLPQGSFLLSSLFQVNHVLSRFSLLTLVFPRSPTFNPS